MAMVMAMATDPVKMESDFAVSAFTDLHTHILPGVDDGAVDLQTAIAILQEEKKSGVERVALTPHFYPIREELGSFLQRCQQAYDTLAVYWDSETMPQICLGAEVRYTPELVQMDLRQLTIGQGDYLLLELPDLHVAAYLEQIGEAILERGIKPILAHVERCAVFRDDPDQLFRLIQMGMLAQIDACALTGRRPDGFAQACINNGLAHIVASDIHNLSDRALCLGDVMEQNPETLINTEAFARSVWDGAPLPAFEMKPVKRGLFGYR